MESIQNCWSFAQNNWLLVNFCVVCITHLLTIIIAWRRIWWLHKLVDTSDRLHGMVALGLKQEKRAHEHTKHLLGEMKVAANKRSAYGV